MLLVCSVVSPQASVLLVCSVVSPQASVLLVCSVVSPQANVEGGGTRTVTISFTPPKNVISCVEANTTVSGDKGYLDSSDCVCVVAIAVVCI